MRLDIKYWLDCEVKHTYNLYNRLLRNNLVKFTMLTNHDKESIIQENCFKVYCIGYHEKAIKQLLITNVNQDAIKLAEKVMAKKRNNYTDDEIIPDEEFNENMELPYLEDMYDLIEWNLKVDTLKNKLTDNEYNYLKLILNRGLMTDKQASAILNISRQSIYNLKKSLKQKFHSLF